MKAPSFFKGLGVGLVVASLAIAATAGAQAVTKRWRGHHVFDRLTVIGGAWSYANVDAGSSGTAGSVDVFPATASKGKIALVAADNTGDDTTTITNAEQGGAYTYTIPDAGESASFVLSEGASTLDGVRTFDDIPIFPSGGITAGSTTITATEFGYLDGLTAGTAAGSKALVLSSGGTIAGITRVSAGNYRTASTTISASADLSTDTLDAYQLWYVTTTGGAVDLDFGEDGALAAADVGQRWRFLIVAGTNALTITAGTSVSTVDTSNLLGSACEDVGDYFDCVPYTTTAVKCWSHCAD